MQNIEGQFSRRTQDNDSNGNLIVSYSDGLEVGLEEPRSGGEGPQSNTGKPNVFS